MSSNSIYSNNKKAMANYTAMVRIKSLLIFILLVILTLICLVPIYVLVINSTRTSADVCSNGMSLIPGTELMNNLKELSTNTTYSKVFLPLDGFKNSFLLAGSCTFLIVFFSALTAYGLTVYDFKLKGPAFTFILAVMMVPVQVTSTGFLQFMNQLNLTNTYLPLILPALAAPAIVFFMKQYMKSSFPLEIVEAARIDGCGEWRTFVQIALPMMKPAIAVQAIFAFISKWNDYYTTSMILIAVEAEKRTMPMMVSSVMANDKTPNYAVNYLVIAISIVPVVVVYLLLSKYIIAGVALGGVKE